MMPPLVRRCPDCGHATLSFRFTWVEGGDRLECPACDHRFEPADRPWLA
jgi:rRNA maturation protein Nop10